VRLRERQLRIGAVLILVGALVAVGLLAASKHESGGTARVSTTPAPPLRDLPARFAVLSQARSNECGLQARSIDSVARNGYLQGSCCGPMDLHRYQEQVAGLRSHAAVPEIPRDPYDISVTLAKRLILYQQSIEITPAEKGVYDRAVRLSHEHGPCCCPCWRWTAFEGQAKYLIARRRFSSAQIAEIWNLEDGCGGKGHAHVRA
jgi:hypothetical protein